MRRVLIGLVLILAVAGVTVATTQNNVSDKGTVVVYGSGVVYSQPDKAEVVIAVITENKSCEKAVEENAKIANNIYTKLKGLAEVRTKSYSVQPIYEDNELKGYRVVNRLVVVCKPEVVGKVIDIAICAGANKVDYVLFTVSDDKKKELYLEALEMAVEDAKAKAETVAMSLGLKSIKPVKVRVIDYTKPIYYAEAKGTPIKPSSVEVKANVEITYEFT